MSKKRDVSAQQQQTMKWSGLMPEHIVMLGCSWTSKIFEHWKELIGDRLMLCVWYWCIIVYCMIGHQSGENHENNNEMMKWILLFTVIILILFCVTICRHVFHRNKVQLKYYNKKISFMDEMSYYGNQTVIRKTGTLAYHVGSFRTISTVQVFYKSSQSSHNHC